MPAHPKRMLIKWKMGKGLTGQWAHHAYSRCGSLSAKVNHEAGEAPWVGSAGSLGGRGVSTGLEAGPPLGRLGGPHARSIHPSTTLHHTL